VILCLYVPSYIASFWKSSTKSGLISGAIWTGTLIILTGLLLYDLMELKMRWSRYYSTWLVIFPGFLLVQWLSVAGRIADQATPKNYRRITANVAAVGSRRQW